MKKATTECGPAAKPVGRSSRTARATVVVLTVPSAVVEPLSKNDTEPAAVVGVTVAVRVASEPAVVLAPPTASATVGVGMWRVDVVRQRR